MNIEKELNTIQKEINNIHNKIGNKFKSIVNFFNSIPIFFSLILFLIFWFFYSTGITITNKLSPLSYIAIFSYGFIPIYFFMNIDCYFKIIKTKKLSKKQSKIFDSYYFPLNKKKDNIENNLKLLFKFYSIENENDYYHSVIEFLKSQAKTDNKNDVFLFFSNQLLDFLKNHKITKEHFYQYFIKYIEAANIEDKKIILKILNNKEKIFNTNNKKSHEILNNFYLEKQKIQKNNENILNPNFYNEKIKF